MGKYADDIPKATHCIYCSGSGRTPQASKVDETQTLENYHNGRAAEIRAQVLRDTETDLFGRLKQPAPPLNIDEQKLAIQRGERLVMKAKPQDLADPDKVAAIIGNVPVVSESPSNEMVVTATLQFLGLGIDPDTYRRLLKHIRGMK